MLHPDPNSRPSAEEVLLHPVFWSASKRLLFLKDASDRLEIEKPTEPIVLAIEARAPLILGNDWGARIHPLLIDNIGKYRKYNYAAVRDLLRVIRNKSHHFRDLPSDVQAILGAPPEAFLNYFSSRFPLLLIEVWRLICQHSKKEPTFAQYFNLIGHH
jgi:serine/threonine-protein kinase/endoribonuclease IRE1